LFGWENPEDITSARFANIELDVPMPETASPAAPASAKVWMTGSRVWRYAVLGQECPPDRDFDFIFMERGAALEFIGKVFRMLSSRTSDAFYEIVKNNLGGHKIIHTVTGKGLVDATDLPDGTSIAEYLMGFQWAHERVSMFMGTSQYDVGCLTRLVRPMEYKTTAKKARQAERAPTYDYGS
jgi:hypothetical protein